MEMPFISIIVPVYNAENCLSRCVESLLGQSYTSFELILVDDGSSDNSLSICKRFAADKRVKIIHQENGGVSSARNKGLELAKGDYVAFVDADEFPWALTHALAAGDALFLVDLGHTVVVEGDRLELTCIHTQLAPNTAVLAIRRRAAAAVAGDKGRLIRKAFFHSHRYFPFLSYGVFASGSFVRRSPS